MKTAEIIQAIQNHKQRLCNRCPFKLDEPYCYDQLLDEALVHLEKLVKPELPPEPNPVIPWEELITMRQKAIWIEYKSKRKKPHWGIITRLFYPEDVKRISVWKAGYPSGMVIDKLFWITYGREWWAYRKENIK